MGKQSETKAHTGCSVFAGVTHDATHFVWAGSDQTAFPPAKQKL